MPGRLTYINVARPSSGTFLRFPSERDMTNSGMKWLIIAGLTVGLIAAAQAEDTDAGKSEFQSSCASCHGMDGKGKGPVSEQLKVAPSDLTILAKKNSGVFPISAVYETIDGKRSIVAHGTRDMPIWGELFTSLRGKETTELRVNALMRYLQSIQAK